MRLEKLNLSNSKGKIRLVYLSGFITAIALIIIVNVIASKALYRKTESVQLAKGTVNYSLADLNIVAMYQEKDLYTDENDKYESIEQLPVESYILNQEKSVCKVKDNKDEDIEINIINNKITVSNMTKKGTKCYIYLDKIKTPKEVLTNLEKVESEKGCPTNFEKTTSAENLICKANDDDGESFYFRGNVQENWVKFGQTNDGQDIWWRILRINGDGTIRLIYAGTSEINGNAPNTIGTITQITIDNPDGNTNDYKFSADYQDNAYVGYYYTLNEVHGNEQASNAAKKINDWFELNLADEFSNGNGWIDKNAGFCNDRGVVSGHAKYPGNGIGNSWTIYSPSDRFYDWDSANWKYNKTPTLNCSNELDNFTYTESSKGNKKLQYPVGLITIDEIVYAGSNENGCDNCFLKTNQTYWTMSPDYFNTSCNVYTMDLSGSIHSQAVFGNYGLRPVINLKINTPFEPKKEKGVWGSKTNPYVVKIN